jgi:DNA-binding response OmpR family regulator
MNRTIECCEDSSSCDEGAAARATVVVAEDDVATRMLICRILTRASFIVHAFENGELACEAARLRQPDVIVMDWMMPVMDGCRAVEVLKADIETRAIPIVMLSTHSHTKDRVFALATGVQDFITKPFEARALVACIEQQVQRRDRARRDAPEHPAASGGRVRPDPNGLHGHEFTDAELR